MIKTILVPTGGSLVQKLETDRHGGHMYRAG